MSFGRLSNSRSAVVSQCVKPWRVVSSTLSPAITSVFPSNFSSSAVASVFPRMSPSRPHPLPSRLISQVPPKSWRAVSPVGVISGETIPM